MAGITSDWQALTLEHTIKFFVVADCYTNDQPGIVLPCMWCRTTHTKLVDSQLDQFSNADQWRIAKGGTYLDHG